MAKRSYAYRLDIYDAHDHVGAYSFKTKKDRDRAVESLEDSGYEEDDANGFMVVDEPMQSFAEWKRDYYEGEEEADGDD